MSHIILLTQWTGGDVRPFLRLGTYLMKDGHRVSLLTHCAYRSEAVRLGFDFRAIDTPEEYQEITEDLHLLADPIGGKDAYLAFHKKYHGKERLLREVKLIEEIGLSDDVIILSRFRSGIAGMLAAEKHHLRFAPLILAPNYFSHMELHDQLFGEELCKEINSARDVLGLPPIRDWKDWLYSPKTILCGWPDWYAEADETWAPGALPIGFLADPEEGSNRSSDPEPSSSPAAGSFSPSEPKKRIVITGGSSRMVRTEFYDTAIRACVLSGAEGIVVTPYRDLLPEHLPEGIRFLPNASLPSLFSEVDLVIHHGGMGTINEAIAAGIPSVILPHLTDGPDNADRLVRLGIGRKYAPRQWNPVLIAGDLRAILEDRSMRDRCIEIRDQNRKTFRDELWRDALKGITPCELPARDRKEAIAPGPETKEAVVSKAMLLKMIRKNRLKA